MSTCCRNVREFSQGCFKEVYRGMERGTSSSSPTPSSCQVNSVLRALGFEALLMNRFAERIYPIPKPKCLPEAIYATASQASSTLQEQMRFERDVDTFSRLIVSSVSLFLHPRKLLTLRHRGSYGETTARYTDLALSYRQQDPEVLEKIRQEV